MSTVWIIYTNMGYHVDGVYPTPAEAARAMSPGQHGLAEIPLPCSDIEAAIDEFRKG